MRVDMYRAGACVTCTVANGLQMQSQSRACCQPEEWANGRFTCPSIRMELPPCRSWRRVTVVDGRWAALKLVRDKKPSWSKRRRSEDTFTLKGGRFATMLWPAAGLAGAALARKDSPRTPCGRAGRLFLSTREESCRRITVLCQFCLLPLCMMILSATCKCTEYIRLLRDQMGVHRVPLPRRELYRMG
jgi:hypothetical protein